MKPWYMATEQQAATFFDVNPEVGLSDKSVLQRIKRFGNNLDPNLSEDVQKILKAKVKRLGKVETINIKHVVLGDIVALEPGCRVPADLRLIKVDNLRIDQSKITGTNPPSHKNIYAISKQTDYKYQKCMAFAGTIVTSGTGLGIVVACGNNTVQNNLVKSSRKVKKHFTNRQVKRLKRQGFVLQNTEVAKELKNIDTVFIDVQLSDADIMRVIRKIQLPLDLPCKFIVSEDTAQRLKKEFVGAVIYPGNDVSKHVPKQILSMTHDAQFIADPTQQDLMKIISLLQQHDIKTLWVSDGLNPPLAMHAAEISVTVGDIARDDVLLKSDIIAPGDKAKMLSCILHNIK
jgi:magnesium-transporting ATPase (P-type)